MVEDFASDLDKFFSRVFTETLHVTDNWSRQFDKLLAFVDGLSISEIVSRALPSKIFTENVDMLENLYKKTIKTGIDTILLAESFVRGAYKALLENIVVEDVFDTFLGKIRNFIDNIGIGENFNIAQAFIKVITDTIGIIDNTTKSISRSVSESIEMIDSKVLLPIKNLIDNIELSETVTKSVTIILTSLVSLSEKFKRRLNGLLLSWEKLTKTIGSWTNQKKGSETYSSVTKASGDWDKRGKIDGDYTQVSKPNDEWSKLNDEQHNG
jgi:hypothetical protein